MKHEVQYPGFCKSCGKDVELKDATLDRKQIESGSERIFFVCPFCGKELENDIVCVEK